MKQYPLAMFLSPDGIDAPSFLFTIISLYLLLSFINFTMELLLMISKNQLWASFSFFFYVIDFFMFIIFFLPFLCIYYLTIYYARGLAH